jgi:SAM-dependent methyltransferase
VGVGTGDAATGGTGASGTARPEAPKPEWPRTFGAIAGLYDSARPTYPAEMVEYLLTPGPIDILDVGCGTGKAGALFVGGGRCVVGVEPDPRMAEVARSYGLEVECAAFEEWDDGGRLFDLLISGTAWHWVRPQAGVAKAAQVLRPGGRLAAFWNAPVHTAQARAVFYEVYSVHAPDMVTSSFVLGGPTTP